MKITEDIRFIGVNDMDIDLFEGQFIVPEGMAYNSYVIIDEKIAVMDSVDRGFGEQWIANLEAELGGRKPDYLVVHHMEPDHSSNIMLFADRYPEAVIVSSAMAFKMMKNYFGTDFAGRSKIVKEGDTLELGKHTLSFITATNVHWPEVIMSYDAADKAVFSADAFGKFGALSEAEIDGSFADDAEYDFMEDWACEARRYYIGIVGMHGAMVQPVLGKLANLDVKMICPLHGPVLTKDLGQYIEKYQIWSSYGVESDGVVIAYTSVYGHTKEAAELLASKLEAKGVEIEITDLARDDMAEAVEDAFRYGKLVLATTTYNGDIFPIMRTFIDELVERKYKNRKVAFIENGSWAPTAAKKMQAKLEGCDITYAENGVKILGAMDEENVAQIEALAEELAK